jgi:SNF2 family DNA or RNA helicase
MVPGAIQGMWFPKADAVDKAFAYMQPAVRFALEDVTELPPVVSDLDDEKSPGTDVPLSPEQKTIYDGFAKQLKVMIDEHKLTAPNAAVAEVKLAQIASGWVYVNGTSVCLNPGPRLEWLEDTLEEAPQKVIVFVPWRHAIEGLQKHLLKKDFDVCSVYGKTKDADDILAKFQDTNKFKVLLTNPAVTSHSLTLTAATTNIWWAPINDYEMYEQANARIRRAGQKFKQRLFHLLSTPTERRMYARLARKENTQNQFLELYEAITRGDV